MAGVKHDPIADIGLISDNLRDRYKTGFPILKEIVQNADDAGGSHLSFGYSEGLQDAEHELLKGPAVFFINDGPLAETDADAILSIALGSKASNENAIGKFGLGMKSLFHLCEAFFYLSDQWETGEDYHSDIFNPWANLRELWEEFNKNDKQLIQQQLTPVINQLKLNTKKQTWFIVWVPLRKRHSHYDGSIIEFYPGDKHVAPDFIAEKNIDVDLGQMLPLLRGLNGLSIWQPDPNNHKNLQCTSTISLSDNAVRRQFHAPVVNPKLEGKILLKSDKKEQQIEYAGYECLLSEEKFQEVRASEFWPKSFERDKDTNKEKKVEDKAKPHIAIVICQRKAVERANSHTDWAVFLPLGSYPQTERTHWVNENDKYHTQIFIHGYFFIDAGRVHIHGLDRIGESLDTIEGNDQVRIQWNSLLATEGCLSYLPQAIQNFVEAHKCSAERVQYLSEAVFKSDFVRQNHKWVSQRYQWIYQVKIDNKSWQLVSSKSHALPLPTYPNIDQGRAWAVIPKLTELSNIGYVFYDQSQVCLLNTRHGGWNDELILKVLDIDLSAVFCERIYFTYFNDLLCLDEIEHTEVVKKVLFSLARKGLKLNCDKIIKSEMTRFLAFIPPSQCVVLNKVKMKGLWKLLAKVETRSLIIPKEIAPDAEKKILLTVDDARLLLEALDSVLGNEGLAKHHDEAQALVVEIIGLVETSDKERLLKVCSDFRLFKVYDLAKGKDSFFAKSELVAIQQRKSLFRFSSGLGNERFGLGSALSEALEGDAFFYLGRENRDLAFGKHINIPECDSKACLNYIDSKQSILAPTKKRTRLLKKLSASELSPLEKRAFRYILHGDLEHYAHDSEHLLTVTTGLNEVWGGITHAIYRAGLDDWRLIDQILIDDLSNKMSEELGVNKLDVSKILNALKQRIALIDFKSLQLERHDYEIILSEIEDQDLWKQLPFHQTQSGEWTAISEQCFLDTALDIPAALERQFVLIKKSSVEKIAKQQAEWVPQLDQKALIDIILSSPSPHNYYELILDQLLGLSLDDDLLQKLRSKNWLINIDRQPIKPEDVIDIEGLADEVKRLTVECNAGYYVPEDIYLDIRQHDAYVELKKQFACEKEGLDSLLLMLGESDDYAIGTLTFKVEELLTFAELIADELSMAGWMLLANKKVRELLNQSGEIPSNPLQPLLKPLTGDEYQVVLNNLRLIHEHSLGSEKSKVIKLFNAYLSLFASSLNAIELLKEIKLLSRKGCWVAAEKLCVNVEVEDDSLLDSEQERCLNTIIYSAKQQRIVEEQEIFIADDNNNKLLLQRTPNTLRCYFKDWDGLVESELIGLFISLLGDHSEVQGIADGFLGKRSIEGVRNQIKWDIKKGDRQNKPLFDGLNQHEAISEMEFLIKTVDSDSIKVNSIFNELIIVKLHDQPHKIIVDYSFLPGGYGVLLQLQKLNFDEWTENTLSTLLKNSAEFILKTVYVQSSSLENIWVELGESDQLDVEVARRLILNDLPANLSQLSLQKSNLNKILQNSRNAFLQKVELEIMQAATDVADKEINDALQSMQDALINDDETQMAVLNAIKRQIANHQYHIYSVPFELFQNADDAVFEDAEMKAYPSGSSNLVDENELDVQQTQFHVLFDKDTLLFIHWGRAINYYRGGEGFPGKERGFHRDLEKMLLMNTSDKQAENQVTGKFGLGFKSVYLISDKPKISSGRLGVEVFAAMLPVRLQENDRSRLKNKIEQASSTHITATAIELPLSSEIDQEIVLKKFNCFAGVLIVFSKVIKQIIFNQKQVASWHEHLVFDDFPEIRKGLLTLDNKKVNAIKIVFSDEQFSCDLLFSFGATGFENFPYKIEQELLPKIWILAPANDESSIGFMINAGFDVDMGRMQLAHESEKNDQIILHLGRNLARIFGQLDVMITSDWVTVRKALSLASDVTPYKLWQSLWLVLVSSWVRKDDNKIHQLVRVMLTSPDFSFIELLSTQSLLPNGLWGEFQQLVCLSDIKYTLKGVLSQDKFFKQIQEILTDFVQAKELVHEGMQGDLHKLLSGEDRKIVNWPIFDLATLAEKSFTDKHASLQLASQWGGLLTVELLDELDKTEERKKEQHNLDKVLSSVEFLNNEQYFKPVSDLLDSQYSEDEEKLRAAFAPDSSLLCDEYDEKSAKFFRFSRKKMKADINQMEHWALIAPDLNKQIGVLNYLLRGDNNDALASILRLKAKGTWLNQLNEQSEHFNGWLKPDVINVLKRKLATDDLIDRIIINLKDDVEEVLDPETVLNNVYNWWKENKETYLEKYNRTVYPAGVFPSLIDSNETIDRDGWMILLFLGSLNTVGRTKDAQHREAIRYFKSEGWWNVFIQENPQEAPEQWMQILDKYLQDQFYGSQYESWMMRFVTIYRFARWLDEYADAWLSIKQQSTKFSLEDVLNTATSQVHAGGGISAPVLSRTLGIGANFILREVVRHGVLNSASAIVSSEHCFVAHKRVRELLNRLGMNLDEDVASSSQSQDIYKFISHYLGKDQATFDFSFDIPFQIIARDILLQEQLFCNTLIESNFDINNELMKAPAWAWDLLDNIPFYVALVEDNHLTEPIVGYELNDPDGIVLLELELAWEQDKVGVIIDDEFWKEIQRAQEFDWQVFTIDELKEEDELVRFLSFFNR